MNKSARPKRECALRGDNRARAATGAAASRVAPVNVAPVNVAPVSPPVKVA